MVLERNRWAKFSMCKRKVVRVGILDFSEVVEIHLQALLDCIARHVVLEWYRGAKLLMCERKVVRPGTFGPLGC